MRGIYFSQVFDDQRFYGAVQKVYDETKAFLNSGFNVVNVNEPPLKSGVRKYKIGKGILACIPFFCVFSKFDYNEDYKGYDFFYFRFEAADYLYIRFIKKLRKNNPSAKILIEFPDYPNTYWMDSLLFLPLKIKDYIASKAYKKYIDRFVVLNPKYKEIYGVKTIFYMNGIDISRIPIRTPKQTVNGSQIAVIGVCTMFPVHGYDRFITALANYYKTNCDRKIYFHLVGEGPGPELVRYKELVKQFGIEEYVIFEGALTGNELTECFNRCNIALEVLGAYRKKLEVSSSLKSREYLARGIPIVTACEIDILSGKNFRYMLRYPNDDSEIDLQKMVDFFDEIYVNEAEQDVISNIRKFAEGNCSYEATLKDVIEYLRE